MTICFDRHRCCDLNETISREWLVTNGMGGYAAGTVAGVLTRTQHGLLVAMPPHAVTPQLLLAKIDEEILFDQRTYYLGTNEYRDGTINPAGFVHLEAFRLEEGAPIFTYRLGGMEGILLEKRIWMAQGDNTTYIQYRMLRTSTTENNGYRRSGITGPLRAFERNSESQQSSCSLTLTLLPFVGNRPYNGLQYESYDNPYHVQVHSNQRLNARAASLHFPKGITGCTIRAGNNSEPYHLLAVGHPESEVTFLPTGVWYRNFLHRQDTTADQLATDDFYLPGVIRAKLWPKDDAMLTMIVSSEEISSLPIQREHLAYAYDEHVADQRRVTESLLRPQRFFGDAGEAMRAFQLRVLPLTIASDPYEGGKAFLSLLLQASNRFLSLHRCPNKLQEEEPEQGSYSSLFTAPQRYTTLLTNYYGMDCSTRDILIALPGLLLVTGKYEEALSTLQGIGRYFANGMLPDRLPNQQRLLTKHDYSSGDTTLWYFYALDHYVRMTRHYSFLEEIFSHLQECIQAYVEGTTNGIRVDPADGLLSAEPVGGATTWMNATLDGMPITPRAGKAVEVNALWYHTLSLMAEWSQHISHKSAFGQTTSYYQHLQAQCQENFQQRFWNATGGYLYDVVDGPAGDDASIRPNQLLALSLGHPVLAMEYGQQVIETVTHHLLTPCGLRTLACQDSQYRGHPSTGDYREQQLALHQGCVWPWLIGPYIDALLTMWPQSHERQDPLLLREYLWRKGLQLLEPFYKRFQVQLLGTCEGIFDGDDPHDPLPQYQYLACATSIGELLRSYSTLAKLYVLEPEADIIGVR